MPALYAHYRFGEAVAKALPPAFSDFLEQYPQAFALGTQGPDILFYYHPIKKNETKAYGTHLHALAAEGFYLDVGKQMLNAAEKHADVSGILQANGAFAAYICGFLCHFTLDVSCHKYIDDSENKKVSHGRIESEFDKFLLTKDGKGIRSYNTATPIKDENGAREACAKALQVPQEKIAEAIKNMRKINGWFSCKNESFHRFAHFVLTLAKLERKFGDMFLHKKDEAYCTNTNEVLLGKFNAAVPKAAELIEEYFSSLPHAVKKQTLNEIFRYNYSGIKITKE